MTPATRFKLMKQLERHEQGGKVALRPYRCPAGKQTIGWGHNFQDKPLIPDIDEYLRLNGCITSIMADRQLERDTLDAIDDAERLIPVWEELDEVRQATVVNMVFNLGAGFITPKSVAYWPRFNAALGRKDFLSAAYQMERSKWRKQVGPRADELIFQMRTGEWKE